MLLFCHTVKLAKIKYMVKGRICRGVMENQVTFCQDHHKITVETQVHSVQTAYNRCTRRARCTNISLVVSEPVPALHTA